MKGLLGADHLAHLNLAALCPPGLSRYRKEKGHAL